MATFDPTVGVRFQPGGVPSFGSAPNLLNPSAGSQLAHAISSYQIKRDTNAHNRGRAAAHEVLTQILPDLQSFKALHNTEDNFDSNYLSEFDNQLEREKTRLKYNPSNEAEQLGFDNIINTFKQSDVVKTFAEGAKAFHDNQLRLTNTLVDDLKNAYVSSPEDIDAERVSGDMFRTMREASLQKGRYPGVITPEQATDTFNSTMFQGEVSRRMAHMPVKELFELGHDPTAKIAVSRTTLDTMRRGDFTGEKQLMPLGEADRSSMVAFAVTRFKRERDILEEERKLNTEIATVSKTVMERQFIDAVIATPNMSTELLNSLQNARTPNGTPMFPASDIKEWAQYIDKRRENAAKPVQASNPTVLSRYTNQIYRIGAEGGKDYSSFPLPSVESINHDPQLTQSHKDQLVSGVHREREMRTNRNFADFATKRSQGHSVLEGALGGKGLMDVNPAMKTFFGELENTYYARLQQRYQEAVDSGNGLNAIDPLLIANQLIVEKGPSFYSVIFPQLEAQVKTLFPYIQASSDVDANERPYAALSQRITKDMDAGHIPRVEGIRLNLMADAISRSGMTMGELREGIRKPFSMRLPGLADMSTIPGGDPNFTRRGPASDEQSFWQKWFPKAKQE